MAKNESLVYVRNTVNDTYILPEGNYYYWSVPSSQIEGKTEPAIEATGPTLESECGISNVSITESDGANYATITDDPRIALVFTYDGGDGRQYLAASILNADPLIQMASAEKINTPPVLTALSSSVGSTAEDTTTEITFDTLIAAGDESDAESIVNAFVVTEVSSGTLMIGADAATATAFDATGNHTIDGGNKAYWTPASNANGTLDAFMVKARDDDGAESASAVPAQVDVTPVNDAPAISSANLTGSTIFGQQLTAGTIDFSDPDNGDTAGTHDYQWYRATDAACTADKTAISGAGSNTYLLTGDDVGQFICVEVTPKDNHGLAGAAKTATTTQAVSKADQTITFADPPDQTFAPAATFEAPASSDSGLSVALTSNTTGVCAVSGSTVTLLTAGDCQLAASQSGDDSYNAATEVTRTVVIVPSILKLQVRIWLQGAYDSTTGLMRDDLRVRELLPLQQPYGGTAYAYNGTEATNSALLAVTGADAAVEWMLIELWNASGDTQLARQAVLIQRDGDLMDSSSGSTTLQFPDLPAGSYQVLVRHRNHLDIRTLNAVALNTTTATLVDLTLPATLTLGDHSRRETATLAQMWAGDINANQSIIGSGPGQDSNVMLGQILAAVANTHYNSNYILNGYHSGDLNLDGRIIFAGPGNDANLLLGNILSHTQNVVNAANYIINSGLK
ncbi:MAG: hypothetical protein KDI44_13655 [Thiothrix sp.]|nr:hypothetical protein [Thiothrix sp.]